MTMLDVNSLYPMALSMLKIPITEPIVWTNERLDDINYGVFQIEITSFKPCSFYPKLTLGLEYYDKYDIEELIRYCDMEFKIVRGYIWIGAATTAHSDHILDLHDKKKDPKKKAMRDVYKLMLNSIYGNTIRKCPKTKTKKYKARENFVKASCKYENRLVETHPETLTLSFSRCFDDKPNFAFIGVAILSLSRRIMNRFFAIAGSDLIYSDTDSLLIPTSRVSDFRQYIGENMGELKVEETSPEAIVVKAKCYYMSNDRYRTFRGKDGDVRQWYSSLISKN
jgi:hypothetical protein